MIAKDQINRLLDDLPRTRLRYGGRIVPVFKTCGITGFYLALIVFLGSGLVAGRSLAILAELALVSGLSFFAYTYARKWITGHESLVLLEHVWFALACNALTLAALREPILPYLDVVSIALCPFLAFGRVGCTFVGCCHGQPSSLGIAYHEACAADGFSPHLVGVRLFPVAAIEAVGLLVIGGCGLVALPFAKAGNVFSWYLLAYAVMRFGLEGLRGDPRPHFLGLSQARWMSLLEFGLALHLAARPGVQWLVVDGSLLTTLAGALLYRWKTDRRRRLLTTAHLDEVREQVRRTMAAWKDGEPGAPVAQTTSQHLTLAVSAAGPSVPNAVHVSLSLPAGQQDLALLCELAARAFPGLYAAEGQYMGGRVLHLLTPTISANGHLDATATGQLARRLYGHVLRRAQLREAPMEPAASEVRPAVEQPVVTPADPTQSPRAKIGGESLPWYFADVNRRNPS